MRKRKCRERSSFGKRVLFATAATITAFNYAAAQDGSAGIEQGNTQVRSYFDVGCNLMYAIGAVLGLVGAIKV